MLIGDGEEGFVSPLHNALRADVDPGAGRHLAVHHQALLIQLVEVLPVGPVRHQIGIGDQHPRRIGVGLEHAHRLAGLHQQGFVVLQTLEHVQDGVVALPVAGGAADAAVHHQALRMLGHFRVQIVLDHAVGGLGQPALASQFAAARRADVAGRIKTRVGHRYSPVNPPPVVARRAGNDAIATNGFKPASDAGLCSMPAGRRSWRRGCRCRRPGSVPPGRRPPICRFRPSAGPGPRPRAAPPHGGGGGNRRHHAGGQNIQIYGQVDDVHLVDEGHHRAAHRG